MIIHVLGKPEYLEKTMFTERINFFSDITVYSGGENLGVYLWFVDGLSENAWETPGFHRSNQ